MSGQLYVTTDPGGVEHAASGPVQWTLPGQGGGPTVAPHDGSLHLRPTSALLDVLEAEIYEAEPVGATTVGPHGLVAVASAELTRRTGWDIRTATIFAIDSAAHALAGFRKATFPDGTPLTEVLDEARQAVDGLFGDTAQRLGYWARVSALRRMRHDRVKLAELSRELVLDDELRDVDALDDPDYTAVVPVTDAVLAAIEALRHHVLPHLYTDVTDDLEEGLEAQNLDQQTAPQIARVTATPFGPVTTGAPRMLPFEPAWSSAREAARHARQAARDLGGSGGEAREVAWQTAALAAILTA